MNYSATQQIGALAEHDVERRFLAWGWTVGHDRIDVGYDLTVEPSQDRFKGHRFLVQVKGTASRKSGKVVAPVAKTRLRQYAINPLPVFLIRATADGVLHWMHIQAWTRANAHRLDGAGTTGVAMPAGQTLDDHEAFVAYLATLFRPPAEAHGAVAALAQERSRYLTALDPRFSVQLEYAQGAEHYTIFAQSSDVEVAMQIEPSAGEENLEHMNNALRYGLPSTINVDAVRFQGSQLFDAIGIQAALPHTLSIRPMSGIDGAVTLMAGSVYSMLAQEIVVDAQLFRGHSGFSISNEARDGLLKFRLLGDVRSGESTHLQLSLGVRPDVVSKQPVRLCTVLKAFGEWARDVHQRNALSIGLEFAGRRVPIKVSGPELDSVRELLAFANFAGRLHEVARALNSEFVLSQSTVISAQDASDVELLYRLLKGQRRQIRLGVIEFNAENPPEVVGDAVIVIRTQMGFAVDGQLIGAIPVAIELREFKIEAVAGATRFRIVPAQEADASICYADDTTPEADSIRPRPMITRLP